jgi:Domain of unknown function (DUF4400)
MASRFGSHIRLWFFLGPLLAITIMPVIPNPDLFNISDVESDSVVGLLGADRARHAVSETNETFHSWFIESGAMRATLEASRRPSIYRKHIDDFPGTWVHNFWHMVYRMIYRAMVMKGWWFGTIVMALATFVDGSVRRKVAAATGGTSRPLSFHVAAHGMLLSFGIVVTALIAPIPIVATFWAVVSGIVIALMWRIAASYQ